MQEGGYSNKANENRLIVSGRKLLYDKEGSNLRANEGLWTVLKRGRWCCDAVT